MKTQLFTPDIDAYVKNVKPDRGYINSEIYNILKEIYSVFSCILPGESDDIRHTWLEVERGPIAAFGDFEDWKESGEVESEEEFFQLWKDYYPNESKWYKFQTTKYKDDLYFYFDGTLICSVNTLEEPANSYPNGVEYFKPFVDWLLEKITIETTKLKNDAISYNNYIQQNLPWSKRYGRIKRMDFWDILVEETHRPDIGLGKELIEKLKKAVEGSGNEELKLLPK